LDPDFIGELFAQFRVVTVRRLFGGAGIYAEGIMFGLVFDGAIYLKVDATSIPDFEREGSKGRCRCVVVTCGWTWTFMTVSPFQISGPWRQDHRV
jgi:TfoX N-terminal domain